MHDTLVCSRYAIQLRVGSRIAKSYIIIFYGYYELATHTRYELRVCLFVNRPPDPTSFATNDDHNPNILSG